MTLHAVMFGANLVLSKGCFFSQNTMFEAYILHTPHEYVRSRLARFTSLQTRHNQAVSWQ